MAIKKTIDIDINTNADEAAKEFDKFGKAVNTADKSVTDLNKTFEEVYGEMQPLTTRMGEAEDRLYELAAAGDTASAEYQGLLQKVGDYRKVQIQTDLAVDAAATTMGQKLGGALGGATAGFSAVQGVMGLVGGESEELEKALLKVQSALAIQQGVQGIREAIPAFKQLGKTAMTALKGIKSGIAATGVGLLVVAIATLVAYWDDIKEAISGVSAEQRQLNVLADADLQTQKDKLEAIGGQDNILKLQGKSERDILKLKIAQTDAVIESTKQVIEGKKIAAKLEVESLKRNQQIAETIAKVALHMATSLLRILTVPLDAVIATVNYASDFLGFGKAIGFSLGDALTDIIDQGAAAASTFLFDADAAQEEADAAIAEQEKALATLKNNRAGFQLAIKAIDKTASDESQKIADESTQKAIDDEKLKNEKIDAANEKANADRIAKQDAQYALELELLKEGQAKELQILINGYDEKFLLAEGNAILTEQLTLDMETNIAAIEKKFRDEKEDAEKKQAAADKQRRLDNETYAIGAATNTFTTIANLAELFAGESEESQRKAFKIQKAANIAQATIDTYTSAIGAYRSQASIPVVGPVLGGLAAAAAVTAGLLNIKSISQQQFGGDTGPEPAVPGAIGEPSAPNFNVVGDSGVNQLATLQQQPTQAYVVSGEVTTAQALDRNRVQNATL